MGIECIDCHQEEYMATTLCEPYDAKQLAMTVAVVFYALPEQEELGRWRAKEWDTGVGSSRTTVWRVTTNLADKLLAGIP